MKEADTIRLTHADAPLQVVSSLTDALPGGGVTSAEVLDVSIPALRVSSAGGVVCGRRIEQI